MLIISIRKYRSVEIEKKIAMPMFYDGSASVILPFPFTYNTT